MTSLQQKEFIKTVWDFYHQNGRTLPWRVSLDPYTILVSEIMLQQTQVNRVIPKYQQFIEKFPTITHLANAQLADVLGVWSGLGYNRRAKFLWQAAKYVQDEQGGYVPTSQTVLTQLPGVGLNTAGAILAYAYNQPVVFIETNIRTVFIHYFFNPEEKVSDNQIKLLVEQTLQKENSREWYWALMDYGAYLKQSQNNIAQSKHYTKQSQFQGSTRQIRGEVIRLLLVNPSSFAELTNAIKDTRLTSILNALNKEGLITIQDGIYSIS